VLATLAILTCALLLGHVREVSQRRTAEEKALTLLKQWLSPAELAQYEKYSYFEVTGGDSAAPAAKNLMDVRVGADTNRCGAAGWRTLLQGGAKAPRHSSNPRGLPVNSDCADLGA